MPRIRTIKPEFFSSPGVEGMSMAARLLYIAMWSWADDYGRGTANPKQLAAFAFPHDQDIGSKEIPWFLKEVAAGFGVVFYEVDGRRYYAIPSWEKHQRTERRAQSQYPPPEDGTCYDPQPDELGKHSNSTASVGVSDAMQGNSEATQGSSGPGTGEQGNRGTGEPTPLGETPPAWEQAPSESEVINTKTLVGVWVDAYETATGHSPSTSMRSQAGKEIKKLLSQPGDPQTVSEAARSAGGKGYATVERELGPLAARRNGHKPRSYPRWMDFAEQ